MVRIPIAALINSESDDSIGDFSLSPQSKKTRTKNRPAFLGIDDPTLKAKSSVVLERINYQVLILIFNFCNFLFS